MNKKGIKPYVFETEILLKMSAHTELNARVIEYSIIRDVRTTLIEDSNKIYYDSRNKLTNIEKDVNIYRHHGNSQSLEWFITQRN